MQAKSDFIQRNPIFQTWPLRHRKQLSISMITQKFSYGDKIIKQGQEADKVYFISRYCIVCLRVREVTVGSLGLLHLQVLHSLSAGERGDSRQTGSTLSPGTALSVCGGVCFKERWYVPVCVCCECMYHHHWYA